MSRFGGIRVLGAMICCIALAVILLMSSQGEPVTAHADNDWTIKLTPSRLEMAPGDTFLWLTPQIWTYGVTESRLYFSMVNAPEGITVTPAPSIENPVHEGISPFFYGYPFTIRIDPSFTGTGEQRVDLWFQWEDIAQGEGSVWKSITFYIDIYEEQRWDVVKYTPHWAYMAENETETITIGIQNTSDEEFNFLISASSVGYGFNLNTTSGAVTVSAGEYLEWTATMTCTGYALNPGDNYYAVAWDVRNLDTGTLELTGTTRVIYSGTAVENMSDLEVWWSDNYLEIPYGEKENAYLFMKNIGTKPIRIDPPGNGIIFTWYAALPVWPYEIETGKAPLYLAENEIDNLRVTFWAQGEPEELQKRTGMWAAVKDNYNVERQVVIELRAVVGSFSATIRPLQVQVLQGQKIDVYIRVTNNENANRTYVIDSMGLRQPVDWATSDPLTENFELTAFATREVKFELSVVGSVGARSYVYHVRCDAINVESRLLIEVDTIVIPTGVFPGVGGEFLAMLNPLTGSTAASGMIIGLLLIVVFAMMGKALDPDGGMGATLTVALGVMLVSVMGWWPSWILGLEVIIIALYMARWAHDTM